MKRGLVLLIALILIIPTVSATLSLTDPSNPQYNIGDNIDFTGFVQQEETFSGYIQFSLNCKEDSYALPQTSIDLNPEEKVLFSELSLLTLTASSSMEGLCSLEVALLTNGAVVESAESSLFEITSELDGSFSIDKSQVQLGDTINIAGKVTRLDESLIDGSAELYFSFGDEEYLIDFLTIENGVIDYDYTATSGSAGKYTMDLIVRDSFGNEQKFTNQDSFSLLDQLYVYAETNEESYFPGDTVNVFGDVNTILQEYVEAGTVEVTFDSGTQSTELIDSQFTYDVFVPTDIESGSHSIKVTVKDTAGNSGSSTLYIDINPVATTLSTQLSLASLNPEEKIIVTPYLYDQAGVLMDDGLVLEVYDADGFLVSDKIISSSEEVTYQVPKLSTPGTWTVKSYYENSFGEATGVEDEVTFIVNEVQELDYYIVEDKLYITNTGNTKYTDDLEIQVDGLEDDYVITKTKNLGVNETVTIDLAEELPTGTYNIAIPTGMDVSDLGNIEVIDGKSRSSLSLFYTLLAILFLGGLSFMVYKRARPKGKEKKKEGSAKQYVDMSGKGKKKSANEKTTFYTKKDSKKKKSSLVFEDKKKSLEDFKERTLREIKKTEEKINKDKARNKSSTAGIGSIGYVTGRKDQGINPIQPPPPKKKAPESFFNIFD